MYKIIIISLVTISITDNVHNLVIDTVTKHILSSSFNTMMIKDAASWWQSGRLAFLRVTG